MRRPLASLAIAACHPVGPTPPACDRAVTITSQPDVDAIAACTALPALTIRTAATVRVVLPHLGAIAGELRVGPTVAVDELSLPALHTAGAIRISANGTLRGVFLPELVRAQRIDVAGNVELTTLSLPKLAEVGAIVIDDAAELEMLDVTAVPPTADVTVTHAPKLHVIEAPAALVERLTAAQSPR